MKLKHAFAALAALAVLPATASAEPQSYPLYCKGGPTMRMVVSHDLPDGVNTGTTHMTVYFRAASVAGAPGESECTWGDRTFRDGEPTNFSLSGNFEFAMQVMGNGSLARDPNWRFAPEGSGPDATNVGQIVSAIFNRQLFVLQVYSEGGTMKITRVGP
ncbi:MAG TPA: hypothetical protein PLA85_04890 [Micropepsaceae bacterium]|nr:hypothetical protein [Micropepsaceae bacterium]